MFEKHAKFELKLSNLLTCFNLHSIYVFFQWNRCEFWSESHETVVVLQMLLLAIQNRTIVPPKCQQNCKQKATRMQVMSYNF